MAQARLGHVLQQVRGVLERAGGDATDALLLGRFVGAGDGEAFAALVRRHGPMVLGVCRRLLGNAHDAEDAFQATFLLLARKAASLTRHGALGGWLYGVARRTALQARRSAARRRQREAGAMPRPQTAEDPHAELREALDEELERLPDKYRAPVLLCDLQGWTRKEAARQLGWREGTVASRLARGRALLARRLTRRGMAMSGGAVALALAETASAAVPAPLVRTTVQAAALVAAGKAAGVVTPAAALMREVQKAMLLTKLKLAAVTVVVAAALGGGGLAYQAAAQAPGAGQPRSELDALRRENELLKLNLEVVLEKVRAQGDELKALKAQAAAAARDNFNSVFLLDQADALNAQLNTQPITLWLQAAHNNAALLEALGSKAAPAPTDPAKDVEDALKAYRGAKDKDAQRRAAAALEKALGKLKEQLK
jgi:RNA polymerase sigma factor (sigma-70 family)